MITAKGLQHLGFISNVDFILRDDGDGPFIEKWISDQQQPTIADIEVAHAAWESYHARKRKEEYPSIDELVVALWEGVVEERMAAVTQLEAKRQAVKLKYPK